MCQGSKKSHSPVKVEVQQKLSCRIHCQVLRESSILNIYTQNHIGSFPIFPKYLSQSSVEDAGVLWDVLSVLDKKALHLLCMFADKFMTKWLKRTRSFILTPWLPGYSFLHSLPGESTLIPGAEGTGHTRSIYPQDYQERDNAYLSSACLPKYSKGCHVSQPVPSILFTCQGTGPAHYGLNLSTSFRQSSEALLGGHISTINFLQLCSELSLQLPSWHQWAFDKFDL